MNICEPFRQTAGDIAKICDANFHHRLVLNIGEAIPWYLCMFLSFSCEWRSSVVQARMCKLGRDPLIFLKILVVIGHVCIYWSKVAEGFSVFNAVLFKFVTFDLLFLVSFLRCHCRLQFRMDSFHIWYKWSIAWEGVSHVMTFDLDIS